MLDCPVKTFPVQYLGLPLSPIRLSKNDLQPLVDKSTGHLPTFFLRNGGIAPASASIDACGYFYYFIQNLSSYELRAYYIMDHKGSIQISTI
jgi:hypothetical protein